MKKKARDTQRRQTIADARRLLQQINKVVLTTPTGEARQCLTNAHLVITTLLTELALDSRDD